MNIKQKTNFVIKLILIIFFIIFFGKFNEKYSLPAYILVGGFGLFSYIYLNIKYNLCDIIQQSSKRQNKIRIISSIIFGLITVIGNYQLYIDMYIIKKLIFIILIIMASMTIFQLILLFCNLKLLKNINVTKKYSIKKFFIYFCIISFIYIIVWLGMSYPAQVCLDSLNQIEQILNLCEYSNHHPIFHTWLIGIFINIGLTVFNSINIGIALFVIFQILVMSAIFSFSLITIDSCTKNKYISIIWLLFYCIMPCHIVYSFTIWKDSLFGVIVCLFITILFRIYKNIGNKKLNYILLFISTIGIGLFRSNGLPGLIILFILLLIINRKYFINLLKLIILPIIIIIILKYPILNALNIQQHENAEIYTIPMQQIARVIVEDELTEDEANYINKILPIDTIKDNYCDYLYDNIKFKIIYEGDQSKLGTSQFFITWLSIINKHPILAIRAYVDQTSGYWNPATLIRKWWDGCYNEYGIEFKVNNELIDTWLHEYMKATDDSNNFILSLTFNIGLVVWIIFFLLVLALYRNNNNYIFLLPIIALLCTIYLTVMLDAEFRYVYFIFTSLPICTFSIFTSNNKQFIKNKNYSK